VVRSGVTKPRWIARPASINSAPSTTSTSPGTAISDSTGRKPEGASCGNGKASM
jgi:hypothetical protein